jgi:hypothetical protein
MHYLYKKTATYNNAKVFCSNAKSILHLFKIPRARKYLTRIRLVAAHVTLTHATFNNERTARLKKRKASCGDRLALNLESHNIEKNVRNRVFANKTDKEN